jgi:hypothetical protein
MSDWYTIGASGLGAVGNMLGMGMQNSSTSGMMNQQMQNQMQLNEQMQDIQQQNWDYTNYGNQRKHMEKAGLNVGLMYGMGGAGGSTMGGASGGSAAGGQGAHAPNFMEVGQQMLQAKAIEAQTKVAEADAKLKNAQADKTAGIDTQVATKSLEYTDNQIKQIASILGVNEAEVKSKLQGIEESKSKQEVMKQGIEESKSKENLNKEEINKLRTITPVEAELIQQEVIKESTKNKYLDSREQKELNLISKEAYNYVVQQKLKGQEVQIQAFKAWFEANHPGILNVLGETADQVVRGTLRLINKENTLSIKKP